MQDAHAHSAVVGAEGHLIDSNILNAIFDKVIERGGAFEVLDFRDRPHQRRVLAHLAEGVGADAPPACAGSSRT